MENINLTTSELENMFSKYTEEILEKVKEFVSGGRETNPYAIADKFFKELHNAHKLEKMTTTEGSAVLIPAEVQAKIYELIETYGQARKLFNKFPMGKSNYLRLPKETGTGSAFIVGEGATISESEPTLDYITLEAKKIGKITKVSRELLEDSIVDIGNYILNSSARAIAKFEDAQFFAGDGTGSNFTGLFKVASGWGNTETVTSLNDVDYDVLIDVKYGLDMAKLEGARWLMNRTVYAHIKKLKDTTGNPLFEDSRGGVELLGYPVDILEAASSNPVILVFGNPMNSMIGVKRELFVQYLSELYAVTDFVGYKFIERVAFNSGLLENYSVIKIS